MIPGEFIINGESSIEVYNTIIQDRPLIKSPVRKTQRGESSGRSGFIVSKSEHYKDSPMELILYTEKGNYDAEWENRNRLFDLFNTGGYVDVRFYFDPEKIYRVLLDDVPVDFESKYYYEGGQSWKVNLSVYPWKKYVEQEVHVIERHNYSIRNPSLDESYPLVKVSGYGNVELFFNGAGFKIDDLGDDVVILEGEIPIAYIENDDGTIINMNHKIRTRKYPVLEPGKNFISWDGYVSKIELETRWRAKL